MRRLRSSHGRGPGARFGAAYGPQRHECRLAESGAGRCPLLRVQEEENLEFDEHADHSGEFEFEILPEKYHYK